MPEAEEFLHGFGFVEGNMYGAYQLIKAVVTHNTVKRYQEYKYNIVLTFKKASKGDYDGLYRKIETLIKQEHVIYGIRNPYRCIIDPLSSGDIVLNKNGTITFYLTGHAYRMYVKK